MRLSEPSTQIYMTIDPHYQRQKCSQMSVVSDGIRFVRIFAEVPWGRASNDSGVVENGTFQRFRYLFLNFRDEASVNALLHRVS